MSMKMNSFLLPFVFGFCVLASATTPLEDAYTDLVEGRVDQARAGFQSVLSGMDEGELGALQGLALSAWAQGDVPDVADALARLIAEYPDRAMLPAWLAAASQRTFQGWPLEERVAVFRAALETDPGEPYQTMILDELAMVLDMQMSDDAPAVARDAGVLIDHWHKVGPFGAHGQADMRLAYGPEVSWEDTWDGWLREVAVAPVEPVSPVGMIFPEALVSPQNGIVYWLHVVESTEETEALLRVRCPVGVRVWLNGEPILEKDDSALQTAGVMTNDVSLSAGKNLLVMKTPFFGNEWFRVSFQPRGKPLALTSVPFVMDDWANTWLKPFEMTHETSFVSRGRVSDFPLDVYATPTSVSQSIQDVWLGLWHLDREEFDAAIDRFDAARTRHAKFWFAHTMFAEACREHSRVRPGSQVRLMQDAETAFRLVLENDPTNKNALIGLLSYHLEMGQQDAAMDVLNTHLAEHPTITSSGYQGMLQYTHAMVLASKSFHAESQALLSSLVDGFIPTIEIHAWLFDGFMRGRNLARAADVIEEAIKETPVFPAFVQRAISLDDKAFDSLSILDVLKSRMERHPQSVRFALDYGRALEARNRMEDAIALYSELETRFPALTSIQAARARALSQQGETEAALASYQNWYDIRPRAMEPFRALREGDPERVFPYEKYDVQLGDVDLSEAQRWSDTRASGIYLLDIMVLEIHEDGTYDQYIHQAIQVLNQDGIRRWAEMVIPRGPYVELLQARTITPRGLVWDVFNVQDVGNQQSLSMFGVEPGAVIEYAYLERTGRSDPGLNVYSGGYFFGSDDDPMLLSKLTIIRPEDFPFNIDRNPETFVGEETRVDGKIITTWENRLQDGLKNERFAPPLAERVPSLQWTTGSGWLTFAERLRHSLRGVEEESPLIVDLANEIVEGIDDTYAKVEAIYEWVRQEIDATSGGQTTLDTLTMKAGSEYGRLMLARQMLDVLGIDTRMVAVMSNDEQDGFRPMPFPSYPARVMVQVPVQDGIEEPVAFDFNSRFASLGTLPAIVKKQVALVYDEEAPYVDPLYPSLWEHGRVERAVDLALNEDRSAAISGAYRFGHGFDLQIRELLTNPEVKDRLIDSQVTNDFRGIQIAESDIINTSDVREWPTLTFEGTVPDVLTQSGGILEMDPVLVKASASDFIAEPTRAYPLTFTGSPTQDPLKISIDVSYFIDNNVPILVPDDVFLITEFGYYTLFYEWSGSTIHVTRALLLPPQTIEPDRYDAFADFCRTVDRLETRPIQLLVNRGI